MRLSTEVPTDLCMFYVDIMAKRQAKPKLLRQYHSVGGWMLTYGSRVAGEGDATVDVQL